MPLRPATPYEISRQDSEDLAAFAREVGPLTLQTLASADDLSEYPGRRSAGSPPAAEPADSWNLLQLIGQAFGKRVLDYRWHSGVRFWEGDDADINIEKYRRPAWLEGVLMYQEGMQNTHCLVYDLTPNAVRDEDRLDLLLGARDITHAAPCRPVAPGADAIPEGRQFHLEPSGCILVWR